MCKTNISAVINQLSLYTCDNLYTNYSQPFITYLYAKIHHKAHVLDKTEASNLNS